MLKKIILGLALLFSITTSFAAPTQEQIMQLTKTWEDTLATRNAQKIADLYDKNAILYATFENMVDTPEGILQYFQKLVKHKDLKVVFNNQNVRIFGETAIDSGLYTFSYDDDGEKESVPARYTLVYAHTGKGWVIVEHHSSKLPD